MTCEVIYDENEQPVKVVHTQVTKKGKEIVTEYVCVKANDLAAPGDYLSKNIEALDPLFIAGYTRALTQIDWTHELFDNMPEIPPAQFVEREHITIDGLEYFKDEVTERLGQLHPIKSIWRK